MPLTEWAHLLGLVPLLWLVLSGRRHPAAWWWLAAAYGISFLADSAAHWLNPDIVGNLYPLSQAAIIGLVLLPRQDAAHFLGLLMVTSVVALGWQGPTGRDVLLRTVAWGGVVGMAWITTGPGRSALLVSFGLGLLAWWCYAVDPGWATWSEYQALRVVGTVMFCWAASQTAPRLAPREAG